MQVILDYRWELSLMESLLKLVCSKLEMKRDLRTQRNYETLVLIGLNSQ